MNFKEDPARERYDRNAWCFDFQDSLFGQLLAKKKHEMIKQTKGTVLEVGVGTGKSLSHYPKGVELVGIDISPKMLARAEARAKDFPGRLTLKVADVQSLEFPDNSFDMVVTSCVFCSVTDPVQGFREINRVLKSGGVGLHLEHVRSKHPLIGKIMDILNPLVVRMAGANINRDTAENIRKSGLRILEEKDLLSDILKLFKTGKNENASKSVRG
ncbi:class I SAM-dependent methyltransferase [Candidatus Poribacteria bacterium]|nr:class I SAM-dependent methyltransferase [Candidatus Poribacteria bacterium]